MRTPGFRRTWVLIQFGHNDQPGKPGRSTNLETEFPDNIRQLEGLARVGLVPEQQCLRLKEAYLALRRRVHELALDEGGRVVPEAELAGVRDFVSGVWRDVFGDVEGE